MKCHFVYRDVLNNFFFVEILLKIKKIISPHSSKPFLLSVSEQTPIQNIHKRPTEHGTLPFYLLEALAFNTPMRYVLNCTSLSVSGMTSLTAW